MEAGDEETTLRFELLREHDGLARNQLGFNIIIPAA